MTIRRATAIFWGKRVNGSKTVYFLRAAALLVATGVLGLAVAIGQAEASGDEYGDDYSTVGTVEGVLTDILGPSNGIAVQVGVGGDGGSVTVFFEDNVAFNGSDDDIKIYALPGDGPATVTIEVSADGTTFVSAGDDFDDDGAFGIDLGPLSLDFAVAVRITRADDAGPKSFDVDAVEALNQIDLIHLTIDLAPDAADNLMVGDNYTAVATLTDPAVVVGARVSFLVTDGPNALAAGSDDTDTDGEARFTWAGNGGAGLDELVAWLDVDGDGVVDEGEPSASITTRWLGITGEIVLSDVDGGGLVVGDLVQVIVTDGDLDVTDAPDTVEVAVFSDSDVGFALELTETGDRTGVFQGIFELGDADGDGILGTVAPDVITAEYDDELDEHLAPAVAHAMIDVGDTEEAGLKVTLCHLPPGNPGNQQTLTVGGEAHKAHLNHGDTLGECGEPVETKQEQQLDSFCDRKDGEHLRCAEFNAEFDEGEGDGARAGAPADKLDAFCERKSGEHERCIDAGVAIDGDGDGDGGADAEVEGDGEGAEAGDGEAALAAFCAHKPDHSRCAGFIGAGGGE